MVSSHRRGRSAIAIALVSALIGGILFVTAAPAVAVTGTLYAVTGAGGGADNGSFDTSCSGGTLSSLYTLDPTDGSVLTGPTAITIDTVQIKHVNGIAVHPSTGVLYGVMNGQLTNCDDWGTAKLITIDPSTGAATVVGPLGDCEQNDCYQVTDITFDPFGTLYAWDINYCGLATVDVTTGDATELGGSCGYGLGIAADSAGRLYAAGAWAPDLFRVNHNDGTRFGGVTRGTGADQETNNVLAFDASDTLFTGKRSSTGFTLYTLGLNGTLTSVGTNAVTRVSAIAFDLGTVTPPDAADLSLSKSVSDPNPAAGDTITFTLTVTNDGPDDATGVEVTDALSSIYSYQSQSGDGTYSTSTGVWTVGTVPDGESRSIDIDVVVGSTTNTGSYINRARITAADTYDPDSELDDPGEGVYYNPGDIFGESLPDVYDPDVDARAVLTVTGPSKAGTKTKSFKVTVTNVGSKPFFFSPGQLDVTVNGFSVTCKVGSANLAPAKYVRASCTYSPRNLAFGVGSTVTYEAVVDVPLDSNSTNDTSTVLATAT